MGALLPAPSASPAVDHGAFDGLLRRHVSAGLVDYDAFAKAPAFAGYLRLLERTSPVALAPSEELAYWINAYNAYTIHLINTNGERDSIRNVNKSLGFLKLKGPWSERIVRAGGRLLTLDEVEHEIVRKRFREPRIHFALVCAAMGCPPLRSEAYAGARLDEQLDDQARRFLLHSPGKNRVDVPLRTVYWSMILKHYADDFGGDRRAVGRYIAQFFPAGHERALLESGQFQTVETRYDWTLNSQEKARGSR